MSLIDDLAARLPFKKKTVETQYFFALNIGLTQVTAVVWEIFGNRLDFLGQSTSAYQGTEELLEKAYQALDKALGALEIEPSKVLFGVPDSWSEGDDLREPYLKLLRKMLKEYELQPLAYVTTTSAISYLLQKEEGIPPTIVLIGVGDYIEGSLLKGGKVIENRSVKRTEQLFDDIGKTVGNFAGAETLPSRILLYPTTAGINLSKIKDQLMSYPWLQNLPFLHFPKIDVLEEEIPLRAVVLAGAVDLNSQIDLRHSFITTESLKAPLMSRSDEASLLSENLPTTSANPSSARAFKSSLVGASVAGSPGALEEGVGFVKGDIQKSSTHSQPETEDLPNDRQQAAFASEETDNLEDDQLIEPELPEEEPLDEQTMYPPARMGWRRELVEAEETASRRLASLPALWLNRLQGIIKKGLPGRKGGITSLVPNSKLIFLPLILFVVIAAYLLLLKASVTVFVEPKVLEKSAEIIADPGAKEVDEKNMIIPGKVVETTVKGSGKIATTGQKQIGDPSKGKVVIYNLTSSRQSFSQGTTLTSGSGLKFTLDTSVQIASQSSSVGADFTTTIKPGKSDLVAVTAVNIGPDGNLPGGGELTVAGRPKSEVVARIEEAFSGGTSKNVTVVTADDQKKLKAQVSDNLRQQAEEELAKTVTGDQKVISEALTIVDSKFNFSKDINDQASELSLNATIQFKGTAYSESDLRTFVSKLVSTNVPDGFVLDLQGTETQASVSKVEKGGKLVFQARFKAKLLPKFDVEALKNAIRGQTIDQVALNLKELENVIGSEITLSPSLPPPFSRLPFLTSNITVVITPK